MVRAPALPVKFVNCKTEPLREGVKMPEGENPTRLKDVALESNTDDRSATLSISNESGSSNMLGIGLMITGPKDSIAPISMALPETRDDPRMSVAPDAAASPPELMRLEFAQSVKSPVSAGAEDGLAGILNAGGLLPLLPSILLK